MYRHVGYHLWGRNHYDFYKKKNTSVFVQMTRKTPVQIHFSILTIFEMTYNSEVVSWLSSFLAINIVDVINS